MLKKRLSPEERIGLTDEEVKLAERYLKKYKTKGAILEPDAIPLLELYLYGTSFVDIQRQYPQYPLSQVLLTAAIRKWGMYRNKMMGSLKDRVQAKVVKSVVDSVDFMATMLNVAAIEHMDAMRKYIEDPINNPKPAIRVKSIKDFKDVLDSLQKLMSTANPNDGKSGKPSSMLGAMEPVKNLGSRNDDDRPSTSAALLAEVVDE